MDVSDLHLRRTARGHVGAVSVSKTTRKVRGGWMTTEPKSKRSRRTVPLPGWLAEEMAAYLAAHPRRDEPSAPLWPGRARGGTSHGATTYDTRWEPGSFGKTIFRPALLAAGLIAVETDDEGWPGVRWHDLRHHFASASLMAGVPVMQVSEWLGHASYTVTLNVYAHWIPKEEDGFIDRLARPTAAPRRVAAPVASVTPIDARRTS